MLNLPESWKLNWVDLMRIWQVGVETPPAFPDEETVAWRDPLSGQLYLAHRYGTEEIDGKTVERGIAARVLEWMNTLTAQAYSVDTSVVNPTGELTVKRYADNSACPAGVSYCVGQPIQLSAPFALRVTNYKSVIDYMHLTASQLGFYGPNCVASTERRPSRRTAGRPLPARARRLPACRSTRGSWRLRVRRGLGQRLCGNHARVAFGSGAEARACALARKAEPWRVQRRPA